jgi:hemolysin activation/secretion protein
MDKIMNVVKLYAHEIETLIDTVSLSDQQRRLLIYVANNPRSLTLAVNGATAIGNISAVASRLNEKLMRHGYVMACLTLAMTL